MYPRFGGGSAVGSSAFEHVFLAEVKKGEISGFHNWVYFAHEENTGKADYLGHIRHIDLGGVSSVIFIYLFFKQAFVLIVFILMRQPRFWWFLIFHNISLANLKLNPFLWQFFVTLIKN